MNTFQKTINIQTASKSFKEITGQVQSIVRESGFKTGICSIYMKHTSASLIIQENYDPSVREDFARFMAKLVPENEDYVHGIEGPDDMPAHIRSVLTSTSETIPVIQGNLSLGTWQGIYVWEHRSQSHTRYIIVSVVGE